MKKVLSLILALVMAMTALTGIALAEAPAATEEEFDLSELLGLLEGLSAEEGEEGGEEADLSAFLGMLGGLLGEEEAEAAEEDEGAELGELLGLIGGLFGGEEEEGEEEADLSAFLGLLGGIFAEEEEPAEKSAVESEEEEIDLASLLGMLGGLFGEEEDAAAADYPKAESPEQFFGTWKLVKVTFFGEEVPLPEDDNSTLILNAKGAWFDEVDETETELVFKDGVLTFGEEDFAVIHLTETGICFCLAGILDLDFVAAE